MCLFLMNKPIVVPKGKFIWRASHGKIPHSILREKEHASMISNITKCISDKETRQQSTEGEVAGGWLGEASPELEIA